MLNRVQTICSGDYCLFSHENLYLTQPKQSADEQPRTLNFSLMETSSGLLRSSFQVPSGGKGQLLISSQYAVCYNPSLQSYCSYNVYSNDLVAKVAKVFKTPNVNLLASCSSALSDNTFFFFYNNAVSNEVFIDMLSVSNGQLNLLTITHFERYAAGTSFAADKAKGKLVSVGVHPTHQCLIIAYAHGAPQVWSYAKAYAALKSQVTSVSGFGEVTVGEEEDNDEAEGAANPAAGSTAKSKKNVQHLLPVALLQLPSESALFTSGVLKAFAASTLSVAGPMTVSSVVSDAYGRFLGAVVNGMVSCVYDGSGVAAHADLVASNPLIKPISLSIQGAFPCIPSHEKMLDSARVHYRLGVMVFDASNRFFYQAVLRYRAAPMANDGQYSNALCPLVYAVSLGESADQVLPCLGAQELSLADLTSVSGAVGGVSSGAGLGLRSSSFSVDYKPVSLYVTPASSLLCVTFHCVSDLNTAKPVSNCLRVVYGQTAAFGRRSGLLSSTAPIMSSVAVGPDTYLWGEKALQLGARLGPAATAAAPSGKLALPASADAGPTVPAYTIKEAPTAVYPMVLSVKVATDALHLFQVHCFGSRSAPVAANGKAAQPAAEQTNVSYLGKLLSTVNRDAASASASSAKQWTALGDADYLTLGEGGRAQCCPHAVTAVQSGSEWLGVVSCSWLIANGSYKRDTTSDVTVGDAAFIASKTEHSWDKDFSVRPGVVLVGQSPTNASAAVSVLTTYRSVVEWAGPSSAVAPASSVGLLAVSSDGRKLKLIRGIFGASVGKKATLEATYTVGRDSTGSLTGVYPSPQCADSSHSRLPNSLLLLFSNAQGGSYLTMTKHLTEDNVGRELSAVSESDASTFHFLVGEVVTSVVWQPVAGSLRSDRVSDPSLLSLLSVWLDSAGVVSGSLVGILTNRRVLLLSTSSGTLTVVNSIYHGSSSPVGTTRESAVTSIEWLGAALLFVTQSGAVRYLLPSARAEVAAPGLLCSLPYNMGGTVLFSTRIVAVLPDRLVLAYVKRQPRTGALPILSFASRPLNPVEPLLLSCLVNGSRSPLAAPRDPARYSVLQSLVCYYFSPRPLTTGKVWSGALPSSQSTRHLLTVLSLFDQYADLCLLVAGLNPNASELSSSVDFPRFRWIPAGVKFGVAVAAQHFDHALMELLSTRPDLQELLHDRSAYSGGGLPDPQSLLSRQYSAAARLLMTEAGEDGRAYRLLDIAGHFAGMVELLMKCVAEGSSSKVVRSAGDAALQEVKGHLLSSGSQTLSLDAIHNTKRRTALLSAEYPHREESSPRKDGVFTAMEASQREVIGRRGGGLGPSTSAADTLAMDVLEDFMGLAAAPEQITADAGALFDLQGEEDRSRPARDLPAHWVDMHDQSREVDKVVGYFRFSDVLYPREEGFCSATASPGARLNFVDLSPYSEGIVGGMLLECFCESAAALSFEESTSNVDPGEKHESSKILYDVVYTESAAAVGESALVRGLRCAVKRGSQWDVGLYHGGDPHRGRFCAELTVSRDAALAAAVSGVHKHVLLQRTSLVDGSASGVTLSDNCLWSLFVTSDGSVGVTFDRSAQTSGSSCIKSSKNCLSLDSAPAQSAKQDPEDDESRLAGGSAAWYHVALTISTAKDVPVQEPDASVLSSHSVEVCVFVNGKKVAEGTVSLGSVDSSRMDSTMLFVGPNLTAGWRYTELRLWSDSRSENELEAQREAVLPLAIKRKRTGLRIRGTKKLFNVFRTPALGEPSDGVHLPATAETGAAEGKTSGASAGVSSGGLAAPAGGLSKPALKMPKPTPGLLPGKAATAASSQVEAAPAVETDSAVTSPAADVPSAPAAPAAPLTAKEKRLLAANKAKAAAGASPLPSVPPLADTLPEPPAAPTPTPAVPAAIPAPIVVEETAVPGGIPSLSPTPNSLEYSSSSELSVSPVKPSITGKPVPAAEAPQSLPDYFVLLSHLSNLLDTNGQAEGKENGDLCIKDVVSSNIQTKVLTHNQSLLLCFHRTDSYTDGTAHITSPADISAAALTLKVKSSIYYVTNYCGGATKSHSLSIQDETGRIPDGVILSVKKPADGKRQRVIVAAAYHKKSIVVYDVTDSLVATYSEVWGSGGGVPHKVLSEVSISTTPVAFWTFIAPDNILLVTNQMGFTWKTTTQESADGGKPVSARPSKILERLDVQHSERWKERLVLDASVYLDPVSSEGWTLLVSDSAVGGVPGVGVVSVHHAKSAKGLSFRAACGCFRPGQVLIASLVASKGSGDATWTVTALELSAVLQYLTGNPEALGSASKYVVPMSMDIVRSSDSPVPVAPKALWSLDVACPSTSCPERRRADFPSSSLLLGHLYCIVDRVFLLDCSGSVLLFNATTTSYSGRVQLPLESASGSPSFVVGSHLDLVTNPSTPSLNIVAGNSKLCRVSLKAVAAFLTAKK